ncbi:unnamed protein product [Amoebophrya sp. A120]|nr:unnamed protein product [Amoebophrya sp. A120]|eukprot:GSA120T00009911001.1
MERIDVGEGVEFICGRLVNKAEELQTVALDHLLYADDLGLFAQSLEKLTAVTKNLCAKFSAFGLQVNFTKTKFMSFNAEQQQQQAIDVDGNSIERVREFAYLGSIISEDGTDKRDIETRILLAQKKTGELSNVFSSKILTPRLKFKILCAFVYPVLAWGCETWCLRQSDENLLDTWWKKKLRHCLGVTKRDHVKTRDIYNRLEARALSEKIRERRLRYFGHVVRYPAKRWARLMLSATVPNAKTKKGQGATKTWIAEINADLNRKRATVKDCLDRNLWRDITTGATTGSAKTTSSSNTSSALSFQANNNSERLPIQAIMRLRGRKRII